MNDRPIGSLVIEAKKIARYVESYQYCLRSLLNTIPTDLKVRYWKDGVVAVGVCDIWICKDGVLLTITPRKDMKVFVRILYSEKLTMCQKLNSIPYYDKEGRRVEGLKIDTDEAVGIVLANPIISSVDENHVYRPKFTRAQTFPWGEIIESAPDEEANKEFSHIFLVENIVKERVNIGGESSKLKVNTCSELLLSSYVSCLESIKNEEDIQVFLKQNPQLIFPAYIECYPKLKLGSEFVTDFVFKIHGIAGFEYVFVEIEDPRKKIFVKNGHFHSSFTQAKNQLLQWQHWVSKNMNYISEKLPGLTTPKFLLVYGRNADIYEGGRDLLAQEFGNTSNRDFVSYDDVAVRFEQTLRNLMD
jgi:hypothetical protein